MSDEDKTGSPRVKRHYDMSLRNQLTIVRKRLLRLETVEKLTEKVERGGPIAQSSAEYKRLRRLKLIPEDRKCPKCGCGPLRSRQFVIKEGTTMCRRCWRRRDLEADLLRIDAMIKEAQAAKPKSEYEYE